MVEEKEAEWLHYFQAEAMVVVFSQDYLNAKTAMRHG